MDDPRYSYRQLSVLDIALLRELNVVFGEAFNEKDTYQDNVPTDAYLTSVLNKSHVIALTAMHGNKVVGGLVAYELEKFEQMRREIYIYDLAVAEQYRRKGTATELINTLKTIAKERGAYVIYVQADQDDTPAIELYRSLGKEEDVLHFDIPV